MLENIESQGWGGVSRNEGKEARSRDSKIWSFLAVIPHSLNK